MISVIVDDRISHEGTLEEGKTIGVNNVQIQRAGVEGFAHNEVNPDEMANKILSEWLKKR